VPALFSYLQGFIDRDRTPGRFILTGSQQFLMMRSIGQSLAGRVAIVHLLPFSLSELLETAPSDVNRFDQIPPLRDAPPFTLEWILRQGLYPAIHDMQIEVTDWMSSYYRTYVERYVRDTLAVGDLETFSRFIRFCAGRSGQILNLSSLGADAGVSHTTATPGWSRPYSSGAITPAARSTSSSISAGA
jgi:hypothetical protein